jgi:alkanesulfonate monooxygenase
VFLDTPVDMPFVRDFVQRAEALDYESLWVQESIVSDFAILEPVALLNYIAAITSKARLGTSVLLTVLRNPVQLAKSLSSLDQMSQGRLIFGLGVGGHVPETIFGYSSELRARRFVEGIQAIKALWTAPKATVSGTFWNFENIAMEPKPVQKPHPPILIGGYIDRVLRRAGTKGDGWLTYFYTPEGFTKSWAKVLAAAEKAGRDPSKLTATNQLAIYVGPSKEAADEPMRHWLTTEWDIAKWSDSTIEHAIRGTAEQCAEQLQAHVDAGVDRIILIPYRYQPEQLELIASEVIPRLSS